MLVTVCLLFLTGPAVAQDPPAFQPVGTISELMTDIIYPQSDELFYVMRTPPETDYDWSLLRRSALTLAESGNLLMIDGRSVRREGEEGEEGQEDGREAGWLAAASLLVATARTAYEATKVQDLEAIVALSPELERSCRSCHEQYHPRYRRRAPNAEN
jgi:cytochrome c556